MTQRSMSPIAGGGTGGGLAMAEPDARTGSTGPPRPAAEEPLYALEKQLTLLVRRTMEPVWAHGYGPDEAVDRYTYPLLMLLEDQGALTLTAITGKLGISKPTASRQVSQLSRVGLVDGSPHESDPRAVSVTLTPAGLDARERVRAARLAALHEVIGHWPDADRDILAGLLDRFLTDLGPLLR